MKTVYAKDYGVLRARKPAVMLTIRLRKVRCMVQPINCFA